MGVHILAAIKLGHLSSAAASGGGAAANTIPSALLCPYALKLISSIRFVRTVFLDLALASRLFFFQLRRIVSSGDGGERWRRALRLIYRRVAIARRPTETEQAAGDDDHNFRFAVAMLSL